MRVSASVPARINIIGEHTDNFDGLTLTFSSQQRLVLTATSSESGSSGDPTVLSLWEAAGGWSADLDVETEIPIGAGLSSSAALCVAIVMCSQSLTDPMKISTEAQRIEHQVLRSNCGLMDQISITHSTEGLATLLDFSKMSVEAFRMPDDWRFKLVDTGIRRSLSDTNYSDPVTTIAARRQHAKEESDRVRAALSSDSRELGAILNESHQSISQNICASTPEIDTLVKKLQSTSGVLGA
ncbi:MAG: galactokinase family protein, partial [Candidatus Thermoplasmatota archaeon]|nr:galactokinase family protein [Candidatus Thermoplasmatota archaeon]